MRQARLQSNDLGRADTFFGSLLSKEDLRINEKAPILEHPKGPQVNGNSLPFRTDPKPRFSDPPAPPPQQPLPEKPDVARSHALVDQPSPSLKRSNTERPRSVPSVSPVRQEPTSQIITLVEALASAKKEIDIQSARMRDLEEALQKERQAREMAEENAKRLEQQSEVRPNGHLKTSSTGPSIMEEAFEPPTETTDAKEADQVLESIPTTETAVDPGAISESTLLLEKQIESMLVDMQDLRQQMESFKARAETAEFERDTSRKTLAEMVEKIRSEESARRSSSTERAATLVADDSVTHHILDAESDDLKAVLLDRIGYANGHATETSEKKSEKTTASTLSKPQPIHDHLLHQTTPYASMLGVVLIGMGLMAYLNGWQPPKVDR